jgi:SAM-dependent methyltransferase
MHDTAMQNATYFLDEYGDKFTEGDIVLDFGSYSVNGNLRGIFEPKFKYIGIDQAAGPNVDVVCSNRSTPFSNEYASIVVSTSCFEHDECFWMTFLEMCRVLKKGGVIYINAPSSGPYHAHPVDCWRFYKDSWKALENWAKENGYTMKLKDSYIDERPVCDWHDSVGIFVKE